MRWDQALFAFSHLKKKLIHEKAKCAGLTLIGQPVRLKLINESERKIALLLLVRQQIFLMLIFHCKH